MNAIMTLLLLAASPLMDVHEFPAHGSDASYFMAPVGAPPTPGFFSLHGGEVYVYGMERSLAPCVVSLPEGTSAVDAFDLNGDGAVELIAIAGMRVMRIVVTPGVPSGAGNLPQELFQTPSQFSDMHSTPFLHVLGVVWQGQRVLGIPDEDNFILFDARGERVATWPIGADTSPQAALGRPFSVNVAAVPVIGPPGALEMRLRREIAIQPVLPEALPIAPPAVGPKSPAPATFANYLSDYRYWPAFPLAVAEMANSQPDELRRAEVLYATDFSDAPETVVRLRTPGRTGGEDTYRVEPEARYRGLRIGTESTLPDFNRDGFADLLLWSAATPILTTSRLGNALATGTRGMRVAVHLFEPKRRRFTPEPVSYFSVDLPAPWFTGSATTAPLHHGVMADFNGDGTTDLAMATGASVYALWLYEDDGFRPAPDWTHEFPEPLEELLFHGNYGGKGAGLALRTRSHVYILLPAPAAPLPESIGP